MHRIGGKRKNNQRETEQERKQEREREREREKVRNKQAERSRPRQRNRDKQRFRDSDMDSARRCLQYLKYFSMKVDVVLPVVLPPCKLTHVQCRVIAEVVGIVACASFSTCIHHWREWTSLSPLTKHFFYHAMQRVWTPHADLAWAPCWLHNTDGDNVSLATDLGDVVTVTKAKFEALARVDDQQLEGAFACHCAGGNHRRATLVSLIRDIAGATSHPHAASPSPYSQHHHGGVRCWGLCLSVWRRHANEHMVVPLLRIGSCDGQCQDHANLSPGPASWFVPPCISPVTPFLKGRPIQSVFGLEGVIDRTIELHPLQSGQM